jgi:glycosyltransferase involved in cell wall biosynthesis
LILPSINSTEAFGMVQVEAMICGTPVVATDLPGVRVPVNMTGMGRIVRPKDSQSLAESIIDVLEHKESYSQSPESIVRKFSPDSVAAQYEALFEELLHQHG